MHGDGVLRLGAPRVMNRQGQRHARQHGANQAGLRSGGRGGGVARGHDQTGSDSLIQAILHACSGKQISGGFAPSRRAFPAILPRKATFF
jgi:hypothetical protein